MASERRFPTAYGEARLVTCRAAHPVATMLLGHGAGAGIDTLDLAALAEHLPRHGITVVLLEQPWRLAGRRVATPPATLDEVLVAAARRLRPRNPLIVGGRSAGARSAVRCARRVGAAGCLALAFPLHPPGRPERTRVDELAGAGVPTLVVQGERDPMGRPEEFPADVELAVVPAADHGFRTAARSGVAPGDVAAVVVETVLEWAVREVVGNQAPA